ncbi:hypothetical protein AMTRI_Chr11g150000 [Amborella trichopoda]
MSLCFSSGKMCYSPVTGDMQHSCTTQYNKNKKKKHPIQFIYTVLPHILCCIWHPLIFEIEWIQMNCFVYSLPLCLLSPWVYEDTICLSILVLHSKYWALMTTICHVQIVHNTNSLAGKEPLGLRIYPFWIRILNFKPYPDPRFGSK